MTKSKRMFAEMLVEAQGHGDPDEIAKTMTLVDIIYEMKKAEEKKKLLDEKGLSEENIQRKISEVPKESVKSEEPPTEPEEEPEIIVKIKDFWSRLTHDSDSEE